MAWGVPGTPSVDKPVGQGRIGGQWAAQELLEAGQGGPQGPTGGRQQGQAALLGQTQRSGLGRLAARCGRDAKVGGRAIVWKVIRFAMDYIKNIFMLVLKTIF